MPLAADAEAMSAVGAPRYSALVKIECQSEALRIWAGVGDLEVPADDVDLDGGIYQGIGVLGDIPALRQLIGGLAERIDLSLNGADELTVSLADADIAEVRNAPVQIAAIFFDEEWQGSSPAWLWDGKADVPMIDRTASPDGIVRTITLSVGSAFTDRTRPQLSFFTNADQAKRSPDDRFCERDYSFESTVLFPS